MAEFQRMPTQEELQKILYMGQMQGKTTQEIINENLAKGGTIKPLPESFFTTASAGARRAGDYINKAGTAADVAKLFPGYQPETKVTIPTSFSVVPKMDPYSGQVMPTGIQTQQAPIGNVLQQIKPADVLGVSGAERAYGDIGAGKAPQPFDVIDTLGVGAAGMAGTKGLLGAARATKGLPVGMSIQDVTKSGLLATAPKSEIGFYSAVENAALASPRKTATGQAFLNDIMKGQDVRADEIKWMGLDDYLKDKKSITKQEVQDYIANNRVDVQEVQLGDTKFNKLSDEELINEYIRIRGYDPVSNGEALTRNEMLYELGGMNRTESGSTKFSQYTLPGGENYREILLTMPPKTDDVSKFKVVTKQDNPYTGQRDIEVQDTQGNVVAQRSGFQGTDEDALLQHIRSSAISESGFRSSHFDQPNILAHLRVNDRVDADGKKMLLIEEVQSDWHQAGRDKGYKGQLTSLPDDYFVSEMQNKAGDTVYEIRKTSNPNVIINRDYNRQSAINGAINTLNETVMGVPDAPFKDTWYQLALKRAIQHAAENGYDRIGLTTGSQQAARFDLSKQLSRVSYQDGTLQGYDPSGALVMNKFVDPKDLSNYVGKELASKMVENAAKDSEIRKKISAARYNNAPESEINALRSQLDDTKTDYSGLDLQVGGEGMKKYYDEIYPKFLDKYGKKWGAKVGETDITTGRSNVDGMPSMYPDREKVRYIDITPEMKAGVSKGQPLFAAAPIGVTGGLLGTQQDQRK
jgi:hypothetical protein